MDRRDWNETARCFAEYVNNFRTLVERGATALQFVHASAEGDNDAWTEDMPLVLGVFGNDNESGYRALQEIELVRQELEEESLHELGFGTSGDGVTWALLIAPDLSPCQTQIGRVFRKEMLKAFLEDIVWRAWRNLERAEACESQPP